jgi:hypothetical protein
MRAINLLDYDFGSPQQTPPLSHQISSTPIMEYESPLTRSAYSDQYQPQSTVHHYPSNSPKPRTSQS